jgi:predicted MFS family arabinose efflux permease
MVIGFFLWGSFVAGVISAMLCACIWGMGPSTANAMQQTRLNAAAPAFASAAIALNTSTIYLGQTLGTMTGGWMISQGLSNCLAFAASAVVLLAVATSYAVTRLMGDEGKPGYRG